MISCVHRFYVTVQNNLMQHSLTQHLTYSKSLLYHAVFNLFEILQLLAEGLHFITFFVFSRVGTIPQTLIDPSV